MAWAFLLIAGLLETAWAAGLKALTDKFSVLLLILTALTMFASLGALYRSMTELPLGVAYPIWTGIGSVGAVLVSVIYFGHPFTLTGVLGVVLILSGMFLLFAQTP